MWVICLKLASDVIDKNTQLVLQWFDWPLVRIFCAHNILLVNQHMNATAYTDTLISSFKSAENDTYYQVFVTAFGDIVVYSM